MQNTDAKKAVAEIEVKASNQKTCTPKVKTLFGGIVGLVIWKIHNASEKTVTVGVSNFAPVLPAVDPLDLTWLSPNPTDDILPGHKASITALAHGRLDDVFNYDVKVNGVVVIDPQLEI